MQNIGEDTCQITNTLSLTGFLLVFGDNHGDLFYSSNSLFPCLLISHELVLKELIVRWRGQCGVVVNLKVNFIILFISAISTPFMFILHSLCKVQFFLQHHSRWSWKSWLHHFMTVPYTCLVVSFVGLVPPRKVKFESTINLSTVSWLSYGRWITAPFSRLTNEFFYSLRGKGRNLIGSSVSAGFCAVTFAFHIPSSTKLMNVNHMSSITSAY